MLVQDVGVVSVDDEPVGMPDKWLTVSAAQLVHASFDSRWWRPRSSTPSTARRHMSAPSPSRVPQGIFLASPPVNLEAP